MFKHENQSQQASLNNSVNFTTASNYLPSESSSIFFSVHLLAMNIYKPLRNPPTELAVR